MNAGLWQKLCNHGFKGKCYIILYLYKDIKSKISTNEGNTNHFECMIGVRRNIYYTYYYCYNVILYLYKDIKFKISTNEGNTDHFECMIGVRQGENLFPFLFSIFLNDLDIFLTSKSVEGVTCDFDMQEINIYLKLIILLYADDTVIFSDSADGLQHALNTFSEYCDKWRLTFNIAKTKIIVFNSRDRPKQTTKFTLRGSEIEITNEYKYLGIYFSQSGAFASVKKTCSRASKQSCFFSHKEY